MQTSNNFNADGFGAEIFSYDTLFKTYKFAKKKRQGTCFIRNNRKLFKIKCLEPKLGLNFPYLKFDINTGKDFLKLENIHKKKINKDG